jgi:hypothetical protein
VALPPRSKRRGWRDYVALFILSDIISAHRLKNGKVFFRGPLYQVNREEWAKLIPTTLKEISLALTWLADGLGVIGRVQHVRLVDGQPCGSQTFVWAVATRIHELLNYFLEHGQAMPVENRASDAATELGESRDGLEGNSVPAFESTSSPDSKQLHPRPQTNSSLTSAATPTAAEGASESLPATTTDKLAQAGQKRASARGGRTSERQRASRDADPKVDLAPSAPMPRATARDGHVRVDGYVKANDDVHAPNGPATDAAPPLWSPPPPPKSIQLKTNEDRIAWRKAMRFRALWQECIVRTGTVSSSSFTLPDQKAAYSYFQAHPEIVGLFPVTVAIHAWQLAREGALPNNGRRRLYHIPHSLDPRQFLGSMHTGKLEAEVGLFAHMNAWKDLRSWFTESELVYWGWNKAKMPVMALEPDQLWEYNPRAPLYYRNRHRDLPPEVAAVVSQSGSDREKS